MFSMHDRANILLVPMDIVSFYISVFLSLLIRYGSLDFFRNDVFVNHIVFFSVVHFFWVVILALLDFYNPLFFKDKTRFFGHLLIFMFASALTGGVYFYLLPAKYISPKTILFIHVTIVPIFVAFNRLVLFERLFRKGSSIKILLLGDQDDALRLSNDLPNSGRFEISVLDPEFRLYDAEISDAIKRLSPDLILLGRWVYEEKHKFKPLLNLLPLGYNYEDVFNFSVKLQRKVPVEDVDQLWILQNISHNLLADDLVKRAFDITLSLIGILMSLPLLALLIPLIKVTSPGPAIYKQQRVGYKGRVFTIYKLRTMRVDAEKSGPKWSSKNDPRVTPLGKWLRKMHLDELPQLFNILKGDLSFVGPRPERPEFVKELQEHIPLFNLRHLIKPGLTGWAQVNYPYANSIEDSREKLAYDLYYVFNRSIALDVSIMLRTLTKFVL